MNYFKEFSDPVTRPKVLVAPLDWGLGHAMRCIPIIRELIHENFEVTIAVSSKTEPFLHKEFPGIQFLQIPSYNITYSKTKKWLPLKLFLQLPKFFLTIQKEHRWLKNLLRLQTLDFIISDNRPGLYHKNIFGIYITHQLNFTGSCSILNRIASRVHRYYISRFSECWIPDTPNGLSGQLSHIFPLPKKYRHIGPLSRFSNLNCEIIYDLAIILSGPEPQRSILENLLLSQIPVVGKKIIFIRGISENEKVLENRPDITYFNYLPASELNKVIQQSSLVISRSGYTSIMDFAFLKTKAIIIPTPGQPEQEYLAKSLSDKGYFLSFPQDGFLLKRALKSAEKYQFQKMNFNFDSYKKFIHQLRAKKDSPLQA